jgi:uncharacterized protein DUF5648
MRNVFSLAAIALLAALPITSAAIIVDPCFSVGQLQIYPFVPGPNDAIGYTVTLPNAAGGVFNYPPYKYTWIRQSQTETATFVVDVILTDDPSIFPDYRPVNRLDQNWGFIGPLSPGSYSILGTVSVYDPSSGMLRPACDPTTFGPPQKTTSLRVLAIDDPYYQVNRPVEAPIIEYYDSVLDHYFMTMDVNEILALDTAAAEDLFPGWRRTGQKFFGYAQHSFFRSDSNTAVSRYYGLPSAGLDSHFFTVDVGEMIFVGTVLSNAWILENTLAFQIVQPLTATGFCPANTLPVYRLWNGRSDSNHRYTIDPAIRQDMIAKGWRPEGYGPNGVVMCAPAL